MDELWSLPCWRWAGWAGGQCDGARRRRQYLGPPPAPGGSRLRCRGSGHTGRRCRGGALAAGAGQPGAGRKDRATLQADAVKTGAAIALGTGGAAYLLLAYHRQRLEEVDTRERRITELYTKAVEQLGHEKAPVRLGALYSLVRLAQDNPEHRQTVVDVFCAYLRMPYTPPPRSDGPLIEAEPFAPLGTGRFEQPPAAMRSAEHHTFTADDPDRALHPAPRQDPNQELQVRQTAQRIIAARLQLLRGPPIQRLSVAGPRPDGPSGQASASTSPAPRLSTSTSGGCQP
jgi:hypothetical protein